MDVLMIRYVTRLGRFVLYTVCVCVAPPPASAQENTGVILDDFAWLAGCWQGGSTRVMEEQWMKPSGGTMIGMNRTVRDGRTVAYEYLQIREKEGAIYYVAVPSGQKETWFKLVRHSTTELVFENSEHDFPQRIIYRGGADGSLLARIEGVSKGKERAVDFPMQRVECAP
jgi:hypothetical protein